MRNRARQVATRAVPAVALALAVGATVAGCATATATAGAPAATTRPATGTATPVYGPPVPDPACAAADNAQQTLQSRQGQDQNDESALDQDFMNFAAALSTAAQNEKQPAVALAMTALANDYTDLVESQSGAANLPDMSQVQKDGAAFDKACSL
jgi:transcription elongation factor